MRPCRPFLGPADSGACGKILCCEAHERQAALGWTTGDVFGRHREAPLAQYDLQGVVFVIGSGEVVSTSCL
jgi:hypothetical protein